MPNKTMNYWGSEENVVVRAFECPVKSIYLKAPASFLALSGQSRAMRNPNRHPGIAR
jgi:hypothetical protein